MGGWSIEHRIPLSTILMLVVQFAFIVAFATKLEAHVDDVSRRTTVLEANYQVDMNRNMDILQRMARFEEKLNGIAGSIDRIEKSVKSK